MTGFQTPLPKFFNLGVTWSDPGLRDANLQKARVYALFCVIHASASKKSFWRIKNLSCTRWAQLKHKDICLCATRGDKEVGPSTPTGATRTTMPVEPGLSRSSPARQATTSFSMRSTHWSG